MGMRPPSVKPLTAILDTEEFRQRVKRFKADARTCVEAIRAAGGKVSLAHPHQMGLPDGELEQLVVQLKGWGLDAIECSYPKYTQQQQQFYCYLADKYQLHRTGGSDFHGERKAGYKADGPGGGSGLAAEGVIGDAVRVLQRTIFPPLQYTFVVFWPFMGPARPLSAQTGRGWVVFRAVK